MEVDITTPTRKLLEGAKATSIKLPTAKGEIEVLPGHVELLTLLETGIISVVTDGRVQKFAVSYGFAEVRNDKVLVLAETAEEAKDIDKDRAAEARKKAEAALTGTLSQEDFRKYQLKLQRALVRQQLSA